MHTFMRQPSTVLGLSALVGTLTALLTGGVSWQSAIPAVAGAIAAIVLPDNSSAQAAIQDAAAAIVAAEQAAVKPSAITTASLGSAKATTAAAFVLTVGLTLCASTVQARSVSNFRATYAIVHAAEVAYVASPAMSPAAGRKTIKLDEDALAAPNAYAAVPGGRALALEADVMLATLTNCDALRVTR